MVVCHRVCEFTPAGPARTTAAAVCTQRLSAAVQSVLFASTLSVRILHHGTGSLLILRHPHIPIVRIPPCLCQAAVFFDAFLILQFVKHRTDRMAVRLQVQVSVQGFPHPLRIRPQFIKAIVVPWLFDADMVYYSFHLVGLAGAVQHHGFMRLQIAMVDSAESVPAGIQDQCVPLHHLNETAGVVVEVAGSAGCGAAGDRQKEFTYTAVNHRIL